MSHVLPYESSSGIGYGVYTRLPPLPEGWTWIQSPRDFLQARDAMGRFWYADFTIPNRILLTLRRTAGLWDWVWTLGRLKPLDHYKDEKWTCLFPIKPESEPKR